MPSTESAAGLRTSEFALPDGVLAVLSWDPYEQLDVARRITALAVAGWVTGLECEVARLREGAADREQENVEPWDVESTEVAGPGHAGAPASPHCRHLLRRHRHRHLHLRPLGVGPGGACRAAGRVHQPFMFGCEHQDEDQMHVCNMDRSKHIDHFCQKYLEHKVEEHPQRTKVLGHHRQPQRQPP